MKNLFYLLIILFINFSFAQTKVILEDKNESIQFTHIKEELSKQWVSSIIQDQDGFMWFATQNGLYRYDGNKFLTYRYNPQNKNSLPANWVRVVKQDKDGVFWLGTQGKGLVRFNQKKNIFKKIKSQKLNGIKSVIVYDIIVTSKNAIWVIGDDGVYRKSKNQTDFVKLHNKSINASVIENNKGEEIVFLDKKNYIYNKTTNKLDLTEDYLDLKRISIASKAKLIYRDKGKIYTYSLEEKKSKLINIPEYINYISNFQNNTCILIGKKYIYKFNLLTNVIELLSFDSKELDISKINSLYLDNQSIIWVATQNGLYKENKAGKVFLDTLALHARRIVIDNDKVYIGGNNGLHVYSTKNKTSKPIIKSKQIFSVIKTKKGIWAGDIFGNVYFIDKKQKINKYTLENKQTDLLKIFGLAEDANGFIWASSWKGIYVLNKDGKITNNYAFKTDNLNNELKAIQIHLDQIGNLWILTVGNGLFIIPQIEQISAKNKPFSYKNYKHIDGDPKSLNSDVLYEIHEDKKGEIWIGSDFGINKYNIENDNFEVLSIEQVLFDKKVMAIESDNNGSLWISTINNGIFVYNPTNTNLINLNEDDGLLSNSGLFTSSAFENEKMYFGTDKGIQILNPKNLINPIVDKAPIITNLNVFGKQPFKLEGQNLNNKTIKLNYNQTDLTLDFSLHDYRFPQKVNYYYLLKNSHSDWRIAKNNSVSYTNLLPGDYELNVKASYQSLKDNPVATLYITVASPWYKTIWAYLLFTLLIGAILFLFLYLKFKQNITLHRLKSISELNKTKSKFFSNVSHEFRTPLTLISGPIQKQLNNKKLNKEDQNDLKMMQRNTNRLLDLVNQLLDISKIESGNLNLKISKEKIIPFIGLLTDSFTFTAKQKEINYITSSNNSNSETWFDKDVVEKIVTNILSNAFKYTPEKGSINCTVFIEENQLHLEIKNTGIGISKDNLIKIFDRFYQLDESNKGIGIGLALVKELVIIHKGTINVASTPNKWTTFIVKLPINKAAFDDEEFATNTIKEKNSKENTLETTITTDTHVKNTETPILLIVEDNLEVRNYITSIFKNNYTILQANNGKEGIDFAIEHIPDIIISDIMMPIKNGIELCNTLKIDERTSHIPIILLTAKVGDENKLEGIKTGADDYITKPFNNELLKLKVEKLIENIKKLQQKFSQEIILKPKDIAVNITDELFLERVQTVLDDNLIESTFNSEGFCKAVGMSRMQLHRKLKALLGMNTSEFIRSQRLKLAAELLKKSDVNVSQIGYSVGFNDHAYFTKRFKEIYNCTPTEYISKFNK